MPDQSPESIIESSGKFPVILKLCKKWRAERRKFIIMSDSTKMMDLMEYAIFKPNYFVMYRVDGKVGDLERRVLLDKFQDPDTSAHGLLISTGVGGVGLTLTNATRMILCQPGWNPSRDAQAVDRTYRMGQTKNVICYRLYARDGIEEHMFCLQTLKRTLQKVCLEDEKQPRYVSDKDLKSMLKFGRQIPGYTNLESFDFRKNHPTEYFPNFEGDYEGDDGRTIAELEEEDHVIFSDYTSLFKNTVKEAEISQAEKSLEEEKFHDMMREGATLYTLIIRMSIKKEEDDGKDWIRKIKKEYSECEE